MTPKATRRNGPVSIDVVVPVYNEEQVLPLLIGRFDITFSPERRQQHGIHQVSMIFVDDGSSDASVALLDELLRARPPFNGTIVRLSRNFGHQAAVTAGMDASKADVTVVMDADLQDPPELITDMLAKWRHGYDVVYAQRMNRREHLVKRALYWTFYRTYRLLSPIDVAIDSGDFCLMSRRVVEELRRLPESIRFPRGLRSWVGFPQTGIEYDRPARVAGTTRYSWSQLYELATNGITALSIRPLKWVQTLSLLYLALSAITFVVALRLGTTSTEDWQFTVLLWSVLLGNALVILWLYVLGAYVGRAYLETKRRPTYIVRDVLDPTATTDVGD
jgi:dolichol-phosphate mannosyltransferase